MKRAEKWIWMKYVHVYMGVGVALFLKSKKHPLASRSKSVCVCVCVVLHSPGEIEQNEKTKWNSLFNRYTLPPHTHACMHTPCPEPPTPGCWPRFCYPLNDPDSMWGSTHTHTHTLFGPLVIGHWTSPAWKPLNVSSSLQWCNWFRVLWNESESCL